jgi:hypothetical protein
MVASCAHLGASSCCASAALILSCGWHAYSLSLGCAQAPNPIAAQKAEVGTSTTTWQMHLGETSSCLCSNARTSYTPALSLLVHLALASRGAGGST